MNPKPTPVTVTTKDDRIIKTHPSFALLNFSRISGNGGRMFASDLDIGSHMRLRLTEAEEDWHLHEKGYHGNKRIVEIDMTNAQFAELITNMNREPGIPCTLRFRSDQGHIPGFIDEDTLHEQIHTDLKADVAGIVETADKLAANLDKALTESGLSKAKQQGLRSAIAKLRQDLTANMPFILDQYKEAIDKTTSVAKIEVEAFITYKAHELGFKTLQDLAKQAALTEGNTNP